MADSAPAASFLSHETIKQLAHEIEQEIAHASADYTYIWCILFFIALVGGATVVRMFFLSILIKITKGTDTTIDDAVATIVEHLSKPETLVITSAYVAVSVYPLSPPINVFIKLLFTGIITLKIISAIQRTIDFILGSGAIKTKDEEGSNLVSNFSKILKFVLWTAGILFLLDNVGYDITSIIAGLGIGGIAIALATQAILTDTFNSFVIFFDKPFKAGDCIQVGGIVGFVKRIGFKTTRVKSLTGESVIIPNSGLTTATVHNFSDATEINGMTTIVIDCDTPDDVVAKLPKELLEVVGSIDKIKPVQAYFKEFGTYNLTFEIRFSLTVNDAVLFRESLGRINTAILKRMRELKVNMPYPTTRVQLHPDHVENPLKFQVS